MKPFRRKPALFTLFAAATLFPILTAPGWSQAPTFTISTVAGTGVAGDSGDGGPAVDAELNGPRGITEDIYGNLYVAEYYGQRVRKVTPGGTITTLAGTGAAGYSGDGGPATQAKLNGPYRVTVDLAGNVYIPDSGNGRVRKVSPDGTISTVVGNGNIGYSGDGGLATDAALNYPEAVAFDSHGNYYVADEGANVVRFVNTSGVISTAVGTGAAAYSGDGGPANRATLNGPVGVQVNAAGDLYISDQLNNVIREVINGTISTVAGNGVFGFGGDGGPALDAEFAYPASIGIDAAGNLYIPDVNNSRIRVLLTNGTITTVAGNGSESYGGDGGPAVDAAINVPRSVSVAPNGNVYIGDFGNNRVRLLTRTVPPGTPTIDNGGVVSASDFGKFTAVAPGSWMEIYGASLAGASGQWSASDFKNNIAPNSLNGTSVSINGQPAYVYYVSPGQLDVQVPSNVGSGIQLLTVTSSGMTSQLYQVVVNEVEPGMDAPASFIVHGNQYVVGVLSDGSYALPAGAIPGVATHPASPGDTITLYGVGFGSVTPAVPAGEIAQGLTNLANFSVTIGGMPAKVTYAGLAPTFVGLYQFNIQVPQVASADAVPVVFTLNGTASAQTLNIAVQ